MLYDQDQCISLKKFKYSASADADFFKSAIISKHGAIPITKKRRIPGIKKLLNGDVSNIDTGVPSNFPEGDIINKPPPTIAPRLKKPSKNTKKFLVFISI